jgi:endonuclease YncB( thermonuclease family)
VKSLTVLATATFILALSSLSVFATELTGQASIIDGDTLEIHGTRIRLWGIDAPESDQLCQNEQSKYRCGQKVANDLDAFIARRPVSCVEVDRDRYRRAVSVCNVAGVDLADWLVRNGLALDWPQYSKSEYGAAQNEAKQARRGMWRGSFVEPWRYRACVRSGKRPFDCSNGESF